ncbi:hypothetical protein T07_7976 [Trichinella nelsoni]|uniref:Uncharacterized protein n=1 Tax=Trichinella nelsoni TaxID=6336 RepID=A0A0V0RHS4_9BILA|nr:hypothetical protein T07_7976 [Trichinella nelsoni]
MCVPSQNFYQDLPVLLLVVLSPEQFGVYGSSEAQPGFFQLSCKDTDHPFSLTIRRRVKGVDVMYLIPPLFKCS